MAKSMLNSKKQLLNTLILAIFFILISAYITLSYKNNIKFSFYPSVDSINNIYFSKNNSNNSIFPYKKINPQFIIGNKNIIGKRAFYYNSDRFNIPGTHIGHIIFMRIMEFLDIGILTNTILFVIFSIGVIGSLYQLNSFNKWFLLTILSSPLFLYWWEIPINNPSFVAFFSIFNYLYLKVKRSKENFLNLILLIFSAAICVYIRYSSISLLLPYGIILIGKYIRKREITRVLIIIFLFLLLLTPLLRYNHFFFGNFFGPVASKTSKAYVLTPNAIHLQSAKQTTSTNIISKLLHLFTPNFKLLVNNFFYYFLIPFILLIMLSLNYSENKSLSSFSLKKELYSVFIVSLLLYVGKNWSSPGENFQLGSSLVRYLFPLYLLIFLLFSHILKNPLTKKNRLKVIFILFILSNLMNLTLNFKKNLSLEVKKHYLNEIKTANINREKDIILVTLHDKFIPIYYKTAIYPTFSRNKFDKNLDNLIKFIKNYQKHGKVFLYEEEIKGYSSYDFTYLKKTLEDYFKIEKINTTYYLIKPL
jgi:hypothetical protein